MYSIVWLHSYSCPDLLGFCARMRSTCSPLYSCLFPFSPCSLSSCNCKCNPNFLRLVCPCSCHEHTQYVSHFLVFALHLYVSYVQSHHFPWLQPHELQSIRFFSTLCYPNTSSDITGVLGGGSFPVTTHGLSSRGVAAVRARRLFPSTISGVRGSVPVLALGRKIRLTAGFKPRPQGPAPNSLAAAHSPF